MKLQDLTLWNLIGLRINENIVSSENETKTLSDEFLNNLKDEKNTIKCYEKVLKKFYDTTFEKRAFEVLVKNAFDNKESQKNLFSKLFRNKYLVQYIENNPENPYNFKVKNKDILLGKSYKNFFNNFLEFVKNADDELITKIYFDYDLLYDKRLKDEITENFIKNYGIKQNIELDILKFLYDFNFKGTTENKEIDEYLKENNKALLAMLIGVSILDFISYNLIYLKMKSEISEQTDNDIAVFSKKYGYIFFREMKNGDYFLYRSENNYLKFYIFKLDLKNLDDNFSDIKEVFKLFHNSCLNF